MEKVYLYVHDEKGYGHLSRMLKIYHSLCPHYNVCILLSGTLKIHDSSIKYIQLPYVTEFEPRLLDRTPIEKDLKKRREFIERKLGKDEKFSLYIDYFPYGRHAFYKELDMLIDMSQSSGGQVFCVMRDIFI
jgi:predicted glycosyltransferase